MVANQSSAPLAPAFEFSLTVLQGDDVGTTYRLTGQRVTIGRGQENDIQFPKDLKCSRQHAVINFQSDGIYIENISDANILTVDNIQVQKARIKQGSKIIIGQTELQLNIKTPQELGLVRGPPNANPRSAPVNNTYTSPPFSATEGSFQANSTRSPKKSNSPIRMILFLLIAAFIYFFISSPNKKNDSVEIRTDEAVDAEIEKTEKLREAALAERQKQGKNSQQFDDSQSIYLQGFRDYKQGNYGRAVELFQACLSLFPDHVLCSRYLRLAQRKYNELIQYHIILGRKYREQGQYSACRSSFRNVMVMVVDTTSAIYKEAKSNFDFCSTFVEDRF